MLDGSEDVSTWQLIRFTWAIRATGVGSDCARRGQKISVRDKELATGGRSCASGGQKLRNKLSTLAAQQPVRIIRPQFGTSVRTFLPSGDKLFVKDTTVRGRLLTSGIHTSYLWLIVEQEPDQSHE